MLDYIQNIGTDNISFISIGSLVAEVATKSSCENLIIIHGTKNEVLSSTKGLWMIPPSAVTLQSIIDKLFCRLSDLDSLYVEQEEERFI